MSRMSRLRRMSRQELAVRTLVVLEAMPTHERMLRLAGPMYALGLGVVLAIAPDWTTALAWLIAVAVTVASIVTVWRRVADDSFEWEEIGRSEERRPAQPVRDQEGTR
jgi:type VI protein secretion system component VasK